LYASIFHFDAPKSEKTPAFRKILTKIVLDDERATKKRRRSNRKRFERRRFNVAGRAVGLKC
jgi:hypothetical protein